MQRGSAGRYEAEWNSYNRSRNPAAWTGVNPSRTGPTEEQSYVGCEFAIRADHHRDAVLDDVLPATINTKVGAGLYENTTSVVGCLRMSEAHCVPTAEQDRGARSERTLLGEPDQRHHIGCADFDRTRVSA